MQDSIISHSHHAGTLIALNHSIHYFCTLLCGSQNSASALKPENSTLGAAKPQANPQGPCRPDFKPMFWFFLFLHLLPLSPPPSVLPGTLSKAFVFFQVEQCLTVPCPDPFPVSFFFFFNIFTGV